MALIDRGDTYRVGYLGSAMLTHISTGLGVLQKPLRDLYFAYRKPGGEELAQERYLLMSRQGMTITYKESSNAPPQERFYSMPSIILWDAVQFVVVRASDKKFKAAFEPLDNNHSRNKDNLFSPLDKKFHYLAQKPHPALFTVVLRRTAGVKALDVHAFVCSSEEEALSLLRALNTVQHHYKAEEEHGTGVFVYNPFGRGSEAPPPVPGTAMPPMMAGPSSPGDLHRNVSSADQSRRQHQHVKQQLAGSGQPATTSHHVYQLTQQDFQPISKGQSLPALFEGRENINHPQQYGVQGQGHIQGQPHQWTPNIGHNDEIYASLIEPENQPESRQESQIAETYTRNIEYQSITKHLSLPEDTLNPSNTYNYNNYHNSLPKAETPLPGNQRDQFSSTGSGSRSPNTKLGQGYSLLTGSHSPLPGQSHPRYAEDEVDRNHIGGRPYQVLPRLPYDRSQLRHSESSTPPNTPLEPNSRRGEDAQGHYDVPKRRYAMDYDGNVKVSEHNKHTDNNKVEQFKNDSKVSDDKRDVPKGQQLKQNGNHETKLQAKDLYDVPRQPPRPVATVHPHKIQGVRVLPPESAAQPLKPNSESRVSLRPKSLGYYDNTDNNDQKKDSKSKRPQSKVYDTDFQSPQQEHQEQYQSNWQFKPSSNKDYDYKAVHGDAHNTSSDSGMNDKLLQSKKKDAEIASVLQHMNFDSEPQEKHMGSDFEQSLGYLP